MTLFQIIMAVALQLTLIYIFFKEYNKLNKESLKYKDDSLNWAKAFQESYNINIALREKNKKLLQEKQELESKLK